MKKINLKKYVALLLALLMTVHLFAVVSIAEPAAVNVQFKSLDTTADLSNEGTVSRSVSSTYMEGAGAVKFEWTAARTGGLFWYIRCDDYANSPGVDITGATHVTFDFYISDMDAWEIFPNGSGGATINLSSNANSNWDNNKCGLVEKNTMVSMTETLQTGWNHIVMPLNTTSAESTLLHKIRFYFSGATCDAGFYTIIDDIRFVNQAYLDSSSYTDQLAVKNVIAMISTLNTQSPQADFDVVKAAYDALTETQKALVTNYDLLDNPPQAPITDGWVFTGPSPYQTEDFITVTPLTMEATVYFPKDFSATTRGGVIAGNYPGAGQAYSFEIYTNGQVRVYTDGSFYSQNIVFDQVDVRTGEWVHLAVTLDNANRLASCYVDGKLAQTVAATATFEGTLNAPLIIGGDLRDGNGSYFRGRLLNLAAYADVRTPDEIKADMTQLGTDDLLFGYNLDGVEQSAARVTDLSANGNDMIPKTYSLFLSQQPEIRDYAYTIAFIGDTQVVADRYPDKFHYIYDYLLDNAKETNLQFVCGLGDITDKDTDAEWTLAKEQIHRLDGVVPYSIVRGNHDTIQQYDKYFPASDFVGVTFESYDNTMKNTWQTLTVGEVKYLIMGLDYGPSDDVLAWAEDAILQHPDHNVIITTHCYLYRDGTTLDAGDACPPTVQGSVTNGTGGYNNGDHMWEKLVKKHNNIMLVVSGHDTSSQIITAQTKGDQGNTVTQMLIDPQGIDASHTGLGMVAMFHFSEDGKEVQVEYYSTIKQKWYLPSNQFSLTLDTVEEEVAAAKVVTDQINALNVQSLNDKPAVVAARAAYDGLTDTQKDLVTNLAKLVDAEAKIAELENPAPAITYGDVDGDGKVTAADALEVLKSVVGKVTLTDEQLVKADTDGNGKADATDALNILKKVVGKIDKFPVEQA